MTLLEANGYKPSHSFGIKAVTSLIHHIHRCRIFEYLDLGEMRIEDRELCERKAREGLSSWCEAEKGGSFPRWELGRLTYLYVD